jgi:hypothetical protein
MYEFSEAKQQGRSTEVQGSSTSRDNRDGAREAPRKKESFVKASARSVSTLNHFGFGRGRVGRAATTAVSRNAKGTGARSSRHPLALAATLLASIAVVFGVAAPMASAAPTAQSGYGYLATGEFGAGELLGYFSATSNPIALDSHGNILIADAAGAEFNPGHESLAIFAPDPTVGGTLLTKQPLPGMEYPTDIAVDPGTDALYVQGLFSPTIKRYLSDGNPTPTYTLDPSFEVPSPNLANSEMGIAVDPVTHDLLVTDITAQAIRRYSTTGSLIDTIDVPFLRPEIAQEYSTAWIAVAPDGSIYVSQQANAKILHISLVGTVLGEIANAGAGTLAVNPVTEVLVAARGNHLKGYSPTGALLFETLMPINNVSGIQIDGDSGRLYAYNGGTFFGGAVYTFVPASYPGVEAPLVSNITPTSAHVSAEVDPGKEPDNSLPEESELCFEYKLASAATWEPGSCQSLSGPETKEADITGLEPNLDYLVRAQARNSKAGNLYASHTSDPTPFHTAPVAPKAGTNAATDIGETTAFLNGTINPVGLPTTYHFEYGLTSAYGSRVPAGIEAVAGNGRLDRRFGRAITDLAPAATYHYRLVAQNSTGTTQGEDQTFTTTAAGAVLHRAFEQVTPVDKEGFAIWDQLGFQAKSDGSAISYATKANAADAPLISRSMSVRTASDWTSGIELDPGINQLDNYVFAPTLAVSSDFTHTLIATNRRLTPDAIEDGPERVNLYVEDVATGIRTFVATAPFQLATFIANDRGDNFIAGAPDFHWIVFKSTPSLLDADGVPTGAPEKALYRWSREGGLEIVSKLPGKGPVPITQANAAGPVNRSVSSDGSRIYFYASTKGPEEGLYLSQQGSPAKAISVSHRTGDPTTPIPATLLGASEDGRYAFFSTSAGELVNQQLTVDAPEVQGLLEGNVYRYDAVDDSLQYIGTHSQHSPDPNGPISSDMQRVSLGATADGQTLYWRSSKDSTLVWRDGTVAEASPHELEYRFANPSMSPDGRYFAYQEGRTIYLYDAVLDQRTCVTCLPDGIAVLGVLPDHTRYVSNRFPRAVTNTGQVFFTTAARLVAADINGSQDVYEFQGGENKLVSPGTGPFDAIFADISEDASDVFFTTPQKLVGRDNDQTTDIYDARIGGGLALQSPPPPQECLRDDCKATPRPGAELPFGGSEALAGPGNVIGAVRKRCGKGAHIRKVKGKGQCVRRSKRKGKDGDTKALRTHDNRRRGG